MTPGRIACVAAAMICSAAVALTHDASAQPADGAGGSDEIDMSDAGSGSAAPPAPAPIVKDPKLAKKLVAAGQQAAASADASVKRNKPEDAKAQYETAATAFLKATELGDDINVYFYLAGVEDKLGKYVDAVKHYRLVMRATSGVDPRIAKAVTTKLDDVMGKVGTVALTVAPDGATVLLAGEQVGVTPLPEPLVLLPGSYRFAFSAAGFQPKETEINVEAGSESERKIELESVKIIIEKPHPVVPDGPVASGPTKPTLLPVYISGGAAIALLGTGIVTGLAARKQHDTFTAPGTSPRDREDARAVGKDYAHLTDALFVGSVVAAGFGTYWYLFRYRKAVAARKQEMLDDPKVELMPWVQPDASGFAVVGQF